MNYDVVIGLEIHVALLTESKFLCSCSTTFGAPPNTQCCPVCLGLPGALPVVNEKAVEYAVKAGFALNCEVHSFSRFDRKNYFYPDLPKAYQITQDKYPLCTNGYLEYYMGEELCRTAITRLHMEEEAGKLIHSAGSIVNSEYSLVDCNRAGIPLIEIVTAPDLKSPRQARLFLEQLRLVMRWIGVSDGKMEEGSLRCDANISLKPQGSPILGTKVEIKNLNSFRALERALEYEAERQRMVLEGSGKIKQESRTWDERSDRTMPMRSKGDAPDYRYFPEPDLPPLRMDPAWIARLKESLPELPLERLWRLERDFGLSRYEATFLVNYPDFGELFLELASEGCDNTAVVNLLMGDYARLARENGHLEPRRLEELLQIVAEGQITSSQSKTVLEELFRSPLGPREIVQAKGLEVVRDSEQLRQAVREVLKQNPDLVERYKAGEQKLMGFFVGLVMRAAEGKADPKMVNQLLREELAAADGSEIQPV